MKLGPIAKGFAILLAWVWLALPAGAAEKPNLTGPPKALIGIFLVNSYT